MIKRHFDRSILFLIAGYLLFAAALFIAFGPAKRPDYPTEEKIRDVFENSFEAFDGCTRMLWSHPEFFDDLYERTGVRGLLFNAKDSLATGNEAGLLEEMDWEKVKALCALAQPYEIALRPNAANAVEWVYMVQGPSGGAYHSIVFCYVRPPDQSSPEEASAALKDALGYLGQFHPFSPLEGKDHWYVSAGDPADGQSAP